MMKQTNFKSAQTHYQFVLGPIKIKDGLFMGDELAAKDIEFIISNKVTHVINTVSKAIPNLWERFGIQYLSVNWTEKQQNIFDKKNNAVNAIFHFVQEAMEQGQSCLIHSLHGKSRACSVMIAYMMKKYNWGLSRCLQFIKSKKEHLQIRDNYMSQLQQLEKRIMQTTHLSNDWNVCNTEEEISLKNTFFNSRAIPFVQKQQITKNSKRVTWDEKLLAQNKNNNYTNTIIIPSTMTRFKDSQQKKHNKKPKSILKGQQNSDHQQDFNLQKQKTITADSHLDKKDNFISTINGNVVHVTVNNFITTEKKPEKVVDKSHLNRPYSSDNKERMEKQMMAGKLQPRKNLFVYDTSFKSPYDMKMATKLGSSNKFTKKKQEYRNPIMNYERPQSANIAGDRKKVMNMGLSYNNKKEELMVTGKKRYPSTNPREELYKWK